MIGWIGIVLHQLQSILRAIELICFVRIRMHSRIFRCSDYGYSSLQLEV